MMQSGFDRGEESFDPGIQTVEVVEGVGNVEATVGCEDPCGDSSQIDQITCCQPGKSGIDLALGRVAIHALKNHETLPSNSPDKALLCIRSQSKIGGLAILLL
jgi:hypothetical protein